MRNPDFLVIGAAKAATTTLADLLRRHPDVHIPEVKELNHFSHVADPHGELAEYHRRLGDPGGRRLVGEASPAYAMRHAYPNCAARIARSIGGPKLIFIAREPLRRIQSQWLYDVHVKRRPETPRCFEQAVLEDPALVQPTRYMWVLEPYLERFDRERLLLLTFEEFMRDQAGTLERVCEFLGVPARRLQGGRVRNPTGRTPRWFETLVRSPVVRPLAACVSPELRRRIRYALRRPVPLPTWPHELRRRVEDQLRQESIAYLRLAGLDLDHWEISRSPSTGTPSIDDSGNSSRRAA